MTQTTEQTTETPAWMKEIEFCHISVPDETAWYCGGSLGPDAITCSDYNGEAICPDCGKPTCPRCAQLEQLEYQLGEP